MTNMPIDWELARAEFWEKMAKNAPNTKRAIDLIDGLFAKVWKDVKPFPGIEEKIEINVDKEYRLCTSLSGWLLLGSVAVAAANISLEVLNKSEHFEVLNKKFEELQKELAKLKAKVDDLREYKEVG